MWRAAIPRGRTWNPVCLMRTLNSILGCEIMWVMCLETLGEWQDRRRLESNRGLNRGRSLQTGYRWDVRWEDESRFLAWVMSLSSEIQKRKVVSYWGAALITWILDIVSLRSLWDITGNTQHVGSDLDLPSGETRRFESY